MAGLLLQQAHDKNIKRRLTSQSVSKHSSTKTHSIESLNSFSNYEKVVKSNENAGQSIKIPEENVSHYGRIQESQLSSQKIITSSISATKVTRSTRQRKVIQASKNTSDEKSDSGVSEIIWEDVKISGKTFKLYGDYS